MTDEVNNIKAVTSSFKRLQKVFFIRIILKQIRWATQLLQNHFITNLLLDNWHWKREVKNSQINRMNFVGFLLCYNWITSMKSILKFIYYSRKDFYTPLAQLKWTLYPYLNNNVLSCLNEQFHFIFRLICMSCIAWAVLSWKVINDSFSFSLVKYFSQDRLSTKKRPLQLHGFCKKEFGWKI